MLSSVRLSIHVEVKLPGKHLKDPEASPIDPAREDVGVV